MTLDADQLERIWNQARIWSRVAVPRRDAMMACWPAPRGRVRRDDGGEDTLVRIVYGLAVGAVPADQSVQRTCATPTCVNPAHLMLCRTRRWSKPSKRRVA